MCRDIYRGEFMRLYRHFAFRDWLTQHPDADQVEVNPLDETDQWWKRYFGDSFESRQRSYFASQNVLVNRLRVRVVPLCAAV